VIPLRTFPAGNGARAHGARAKAGTQSFFLSFFYAQWMLFGGLQANHVDLPRAAYLDTDLPLVKKHADARARLGSAPIRVVLEHQPTSTYPERICRRCNRGVDDEAHRLLKCRAGAVQSIAAHQEEVHHLLEKPPFS
jgi:hypothetical protein